jgi:hypothetical protein
MLVQKKSKTRQIVLVVVFVIIMAVAIYIFTRGPGVTDDPSFFTNEPQTVSQTPIQEFDASIFGEEEITQLRDRSSEPYADQYQGSPSDKDVVLPPKNMYVYNPQVGRKLIIYWENPDENNSIRIYRSEVQDDLGDVLANKIVGETNYQDANLTDGNIYYYTVRAVGQNDNESENTTQISGIPTDIFPPESPTGVAIKDLLTGDEVEISWTIPTDSDFDYVRIYRSDEEGELGALILDKEVSESKYVDDSLEAGITYYYTLTAVDETGNESEKVLLPPGGNESPFEAAF